PSEDRFQAAGDEFVPSSDGPGLPGFERCSGLLNTAILRKTMLQDISLPVSSRLPVFPGDPAISLELALSMAGGHPCNVTRIDMGAHTGTHVDAPFHFDP